MGGARPVPEAGGARPVPEAGGRPPLEHVAAEHVAALESARREAAAVIDDLYRELAAVAESTAQSPDDEHDAEGSTVGYERARVQALLAAAHERLARLDHAIASSREGRTARCARCGVAIDPERLRAVPGTARCTACARLTPTLPGLPRPRPPRKGPASPLRPGRAGK